MQRFFAVQSHIAGYRAEVTIVEKIWCAWIGIMQHKIFEIIEMSLVERSFSGCVIVFSNIIQFERCASRQMRQRRRYRVDKMFGESCSQIVGDVRAV